MNGLTIVSIVSIVSAATFFFATAMTRSSIAKAVWETHDYISMRAS
jgi:hypothetical protein